MRRLFASASLALLFLFGACAQADERELSVETQEGAVHRFTVELALTPDEQRRGLMYREELAEDGVDRQSGVEGAHRRGVAQPRSSRKRGWLERV